MQYRHKKCYLFILHSLPATYSGILIFSRKPTMMTLLCYLDYSNKSIFSVLLFLFIYSIIIFLLSLLESMKKENRIGHWYKVDLKLMECYFFFLVHFRFKVNCFPFPMSSISSWRMSGKTLNYAKTHFHVLKNPFIWVCVLKNEFQKV